MKKYFNISFLILSILIPLAVGLFVRFDDLEVWEKNKDKFFLEDDRPILTSIDGYIFARYGEEYKEGVYRAGETDPLRFLPDNILTLEDEKYDYKILYPAPIPLESWLAGNLSKLLNKPIEYIAFWITPILAVLVVIPIVLIFRKHLDLYITGYLGALTTVLSLNYLSRTSLGRFDTDSLNLFFPFMIIFFMYKVLDESRDKIKYIYAVITGIFLYLYYWWYFHADLIVLLILAFIVVLLINKWKSLKKSDLVSLLIIVLISNPLVLFNGFISLLKRVLSLSIYPEPDDYPYPSVVASISELQKYPFSKLVDITIGNEVLFILGLLGSTLFFVRYWRKSLLIIPIFLIGLMAFKNGHRFTMYLTPFIGIGLGFIIDYLINFMREEKRNIIRFILIPVLLVFTLFLSLGSLNHVELPKFPKELAVQFNNLKNETPKDSWIWTWWDFGYPIQFYSKRGTYFDGGTQGSPKLYYVAYSFITDKPKYSYNTIMSISSVGVEKLEYLREKENIPVEKIVKDVKDGKFIKDIDNPIYLMFTKDLLGKFYWIHYFGSWDFKERKGVYKELNTLSKCKSITPSVLQCGKNLTIDLDKGLVNIKTPIITEERKIKFIVLKNKEDYKIIPKNNEGLVFEIVIGKNNRTSFILIDEDIFNTMFNKMFILRDYDKRYFELVKDDFPTVVIYKVKSIKEVGKR